MKKALFNNLARPLLERLGTVAATYVVTVGVSEAQFTELWAAFTALILVGIDLVLARQYRKHISQAGA